MRLGDKVKEKATYEAGTKQGLFLSAQQRSLHNVDRLKARPWWTVDETTYGDDLRKLAAEWRTIRKEGLNVLGLKKDGFKDESESLKDKGDWKEFMLWARGKKMDEKCKKTPQTCSLLEDFKAAVNCKRGQIKFSVMKPGTHVWAHTGPTNTRIRGHLGLAGTAGAKIRVGDEIREWKEGDFIVFDDSFEHEVWHEGNKTRLVLIVDMWHPDLTEEEKNSLSPI
jgi:aspartate beta-hydroxylase